MLISQCPECGGNRWIGPANDEGNVQCYRCRWINKETFTKGGNLSLSNTHGETLGEVSRTEG